MKKNVKELYEDVSAYHDIVSDLREIWYDMNAILDMQDKVENDILVGMREIVDGFEDYIWKSMDKIEKLEEDN
jgi:hypothetical protein